MVGWFRQMFRRPPAPEVRAQDVARLVQRVADLQHQQALMRCDLVQMRAGLRRVERGSGPLRLVRSGEPLE